MIIHFLVYKRLRITTTSWQSIKKVSSQCNDGYDKKLKIFSPLISQIIPLLLSQFSLHFQLCFSSNSTPLHALSGHLRCCMQEPEKGKGEKIPNFWPFPQKTTSATSFFSLKCRKEGGRSSVTRPRCRWVQGGKWTRNPFFGNTYT